ncbi:MAG: hypothetical protein AAF513_09830 [Pseudomonadota bacterium]
MDFLLVIFTFATIIVAISIAGGLYANHQKLRAKEAARGELDDDLAAEVDSLRARIETLEAIVTDEKYQLAKEIDQLQRHG